MGKAEQFSCSAVSEGLSGISAAPHAWIWCVVGYVPGFKLRSIDRAVNSVDTCSYNRQYFHQFICLSFSFTDRFCWFLRNEDIRERIENNPEYFSMAMLNVYGATDLMFAGEDDLQEARSFSKKLLDKVVSVGTREQTDVTLPNLNRAVIHSFS